VTNGFLMWKVGNMRDTESHAFDKCLMKCLCKHTHKYWHTFIYYTIVYRLKKCCSCWSVLHLSMAN